MKKLLYGFVLCLSASAFVACDDYNNPNEDKFGVDPQSGWVQFNVASTTVLSGVVTEFSVPVTLNAPVNEDGLTVNYSVTDVTGSTAGAVSYSGEAMVPKGSLTGNIVFTMPATPVASCVEFTVTITGTSRSNVQVGFPDSDSPISTTVRIASRDAFLGTYDAVEDGQFEYETVVTAGEAPNELVISNVYGTDPDSQTHVFLDTFGGTVSFPNFADNYLFTDGDVGDIFLSADFAGIKGATANTPSYYNSCGNAMLDLNFFLVYGPANELDFTPDINLVMTKQ